MRGLHRLNDDGAPHAIEPNGYSTRDDGGRLAVLDGSGNLVAREGDRISIGGGEIDAPGTWLACGGTTVLAP